MDAADAGPAPARGRAAAAATVPGHGRSTRPRPSSERGGRRQPPSRRWWRGRPRMMPMTTAPALAPSAGPCAPRRPNVVVLLADDMGWGDPAPYGAGIPTPHLDRLAREGMRLTDAHSSSAVCTPSRYGLITGRYAWRSPLRRGVLGPHGPAIIEPTRPTLALVLRDAGYATAAFGKWHLGLGWRRHGGAAGTPSAPRPSATSGGSLGAGVRHRLRRRLRRPLHRRSAGARLRPLLRHRWIDGHAALLLPGSGPHT